MSRRSRKKQSLKYPTGLICVALIAFLSSLGVSYAAWNDGLAINSIVSTGEIAPVFLWGERDGVRISPSDDGRLLNIEIDNAYPDSHYSILYCVVNHGTLPVEYDTTASSVDNASQLSICHIDPLGILSPGESKQGSMSITVGSDVNPSSRYTFSIGLLFRQVP